MLHRKFQPQVLGKGRKITVWEANWDTSTLPESLADQARKQRLLQNGTGDADFLGFYENVYPWLAAYSEGDVPTPEEAFQLSDKDLDSWYNAVCYTNPDIFPEPLIQPTTVTFRDKSTLSVVSSRLPSSLRRIIHLDNIAHNHLDKQPTELQEFARLKVYAKLAGCTVGDVPTYEEATKMMPASELQVWYEGVLRTNPQIFLTASEEAESILKDKTEDLAKKNYTPGKSSNSSKASSRRRKGQTSQP